VRDAFLVEATAGNARLLNRLRRLLAAHEAVDDRRDRLTGLVRGLETGVAAALLREEGDVAPDSRRPLPPAYGPAPGETVGRYRILRPLGEGGMGAVYEAHDPILDRSVALKFLPAGLESEIRLLEEARAASALDHPCIGTVYEVGENAMGRGFMVMACYRGGTLRDRMRHGPLPVEDAVRIAVQVADALDAAHARGILHRDVKPENLLFDDTGRVKVVDFGIARVADRPGRSGTTGGTVAYMSPEQLRGDRLDGRSDLWSLGVVLFEMLAGARPFQARDRAALAAAVQSAEAPPIREMRPDVPPPLAAVVARTLHRDPADRHPTGKALAAALRAAALPTATPPQPVAPPLEARRAAGLLAVAVLGLVIVGGALVRQAPRLMDARGFAGQAFSARGAVLVTEFDAPAELAELALATREALVVDLQQSGYVRVLARSRIEETLGRMGHLPDRRVEGRLALEVAERAGAGAVLETTVARAGTRFVLSGRALDPRSGEELFAVRTAAGERRLLEAVERLSREVRRRLGEAAESLVESRPLPQVTTASLEALRLYALAERAVAFDASTAPGYLEAALELDPGFAMAHRLLAATGVNRMRFEVTVRHLQLAWEYRDRLPDRERWLVEAAHASETAYDPFRAEALYQRIVARFPDEFIAWANLGNTRLSWLHDADGALTAFERAAELEPDALRTLPTAAMAALILGRPERADSLMAQVVAPALEPMRARWRVTRAFWHADREALVDGCVALLAAKHSPLPQADDREVCGSMLLVAGVPERALAALEGVHDEYLHRGSFRNLASILQSLAVSDLARGDTVRARGRFLAALDLVPPDAFGEPDRYIVRTNLRIHAARLGFHDVVERIGAHFPALDDPEHLLGRGGEQLVRAATAVARGDGATALTALDAAFPPGVMAMGWRTFDELLRGQAHELLAQEGPAAVHYRRALNRGWASAPGLTKDRLNMIDAEAGLARVCRRVPQRVREVDPGAAGAAQAGGNGAAVDDASLNAVAACHGGHP